MAEQNMLYKLMILYMLDNVDFPLTYTHLSDFILGRGYTDYIIFQTALSELGESGLIRQETVRNTTYFSITPEGSETSGFFHGRITSAIRADIDEWIRENRLAMINDVSVLADYYRCTSGDYEVRCLIREKKKTLCDLRLTVTDADVASAISLQWKKKYENIYAYLMNELMQ